MPEPTGTSERMRNARPSKRKGAEMMPAVGAPSVAFTVTRCASCSADVPDSAGLKETGGIHIIRHRFCRHSWGSRQGHQELAGHQNLTTTHTCTCRRPLRRRPWTCSSEARWQKKLGKAGDENRLQQSGRQAWIRLSSPTQTGDGDNFLPKCAECHRILASLVALRCSGVCPFSPRFWRHTGDKNRVSLPLMEWWAARSEARSAPWSTGARQWRSRRRRACSGSPGRRFHSTRAATRPVRLLLSTKGSFWAGHRERRSPRTTPGG